MNLRDFINKATNSMNREDIVDFDEEAIESSAELDYKIVINAYYDVNIRSYTEMNIKNIEIDHERRSIKVEVI